MLTELDLKKEVKRQLGDLVCFVEHGQGGDSGFSDAVVFWEKPATPNNKTLRKKAVFLELKKNQDSKLRPSQKEFARKVILNRQYYLVCYWDEDGLPTVELVMYIIRKLAVVQQWKCEGLILNAITCCIEHWETERHGRGGLDVREADAIRWLK